MADELKITQQMILINGSLRKQIAPTTLSITQDAAQAYEDVNSIPTSEEAVTTFGSIGTEGWCYLQNIDTTNYVEWGFSTGVYGGRLEAGETAMFRLNPAANLYLKSNTAACLVQIVVFED